jgi:hypothetical protein
LILIRNNSKIIFPEKWQELSFTNYGFGKGKIKINKNKFGGRDCFTEWSRNKNNFYYQIYLSVSEFEEIVQNLEEKETNIYELSFKNKLLLLFYYMAQYPTYYNISMHFNISICTVSKIIYEIIPIIYKYFHKLIPNHKINEDHSCMTKYISFVIDGTPHPIYRRYSQNIYYRGDKKIHFVQTFLLIGN